MGISGICSKLIGDFLQTLSGWTWLFSSLHNDHSSPTNSKSLGGENRVFNHDVMLRALITVFGMQENGKIKKERAMGVVEKLGLIQSEEEKAGFELPRRAKPARNEDEDEDEMMVEDVICEMEEETRKGSELLCEAFKIFDVDGDGFIDTLELKRVLECLGLDKGWGIREIEKMVSVVDLNLDGKVDFNEFELMMGVKCLS